MVSASTKIPIYQATELTIDIWWNCAENRDNIIHNFTSSVFSWNIDHAFSIANVFILKKSYLTLHSWETSINKSNNQCSSWQTYGCRQERNKCTIEYFVYQVINISVSLNLWPQSIWKITWWSRVHLWSLAKQGFSQWEKTIHIYCLPSLVENLLN